MNPNIREAQRNVLSRVFEEVEHQHIVEYADNNIMLPPSSSNNKELMPWKTYGFQKLLLHASADLDTEDVVAIKPVQIGATKCITIVLGYESAHRKRHNAIWLPTRYDANQYSSVELQALLENCPAVSNALRVDYDKRDKDNTTRRRSFEGAQSYCRATQTLQDVSSIPIEHAFCDEVSKYPKQLRADKDDVGKAPIDGIRGRVASANDRCVTMTSTCTEYGSCQITHEFNRCRERFERGYFCPSCGVWHVFEWGSPETVHGFKWETVFDEDGGKDDYLSSKSVYYQCPSCDHRHYYEDLEELDDEHGEYRSERLRFDEKVYRYYDLKTGAEVPSPHSVGIQMRGWFSRRKSWSVGVYDYLTAIRDRAEGKPQKMVDWEQDYLGRAYVPPAAMEQVRYGYLAYKQEQEPEWGAEIPLAAQALTVWWDVQEDRIEGLVCAWGFGEECWLIDHIVRWGNAERTNVLQEVQAMTSKIYEKANGARLPVFLSGIDAGYLSDAVNGICEKAWKFKIIPTMGDKSIGKPVLQARTRTKKRHDTFQTTVCTNSAKDIIFSRYKIEIPGPGYIHIPRKDCFNESFLKQMTAEVKRIVRGVLRWVERNENLPNEGLDMMVGNLVIIMLAQQRFGFKFVPSEVFRDDLSGINSEGDSADPYGELAASW